MGNHQGTVSFTKDEAGQLEISTSRVAQGVEPTTMTLDREQAAEIAGKLHDEFGAKKPEPAKPVVPPKPVASTSSGAPAKP
jgi:hypothetical protein